MHGNVLEVNNQKLAALPANLPFTLTNVCGTITITPTNSADASLQFEERNSDDSGDHGDSRVRFQGAFTGPLMFPALNTTTRIHVIVFDKNNKQLVEVIAPIGAFTSGTATPAPCPSTTAVATATPTATPTPTPAPIVSATPTATPTPTPTPTPII